jgi:hypothetical protein
VFKVILPHIAEHGNYVFFSLTGQLLQEYKETSADVWLKPNLALPTLGRKFLALFGKGFI